MLPVVFLPAVYSSEIAALVLSMTPVLTKESDEKKARSLLYEGIDLSEAGDLEGAIARFQAVLDLTASAPSALTGGALVELAYAYFDLDQHAAAIPFFEQAIAFYSDPAEAEVALAESEYASLLISLYGSLGVSHRNLAHFGTALDAYYRALSGGELLDPVVRSAILVHTGIIEGEIGQYAQAEVTLQQAIELIATEDDAEKMGSVIAALGWLYERQAKYEPAILHYERAIALFNQTNNYSEEIRTINNLGVAYLKQNKQPEARAALQDGLRLLEANDDPIERAILLDSFGLLHQAAGEVDTAWLTYQQALQLSRQHNNKISEIESLLNLGSLMEQQAQPDLAIFFYKQAITNIETIRQDLQQLSQSIQQRYTLTVEDFYRNLADLLLQQNRVSEALQVLELLKLQEVKAYLHSTGPDDTNTEGLNTPAEVALNETLSNLSPDTDLSTFLELPEVTQLSERSVGSESDRYELQSIESLQAALKQQPVKTAALYPLILDNRLEIILITAEGIPVHDTQPVSKTDLTETVAQLQRKLSTSVLDPKAEAQQIYDWLIRPIESTLTEQGIENIIYLPDGVLRYVPIAALYDGERWFAEKFQSHNITAAAIDSLTDPSPQNRTVLAGAFTDDSPAHTVRVGQQTFTYDGLPAAKQEVERLLSVMPQTTALLNQDFTPASTLAAAQDKQIVHLATHAKFLPGQPESSFILFGDGSAVNLRDVGEWQLPNVELVVFSACQTATSVEGEGKELLGLGYQVQQTGAGSAIASLWTVDDTSTAVLMNQFYIALSQGKTKAAALQQAQQALIETDSFGHPYDWAAFILIGNGL